MAGFFGENGIRAAAVHSGPKSAPRATSLAKLSQGELDVIFAVDMFNEGVDVPNIDTVMMLRPTESRIVWVQQFGRGLRVAKGKEHLRVIDYIGNHRSFLLKPQTLLGLGRSDRQLASALQALEKGENGLPYGCQVTYDLEAINILRALLRPPKADEFLREWYEQFKEGQGHRPTAVEAFHEGHDPRSTKKSYGGWLEFIAGVGDLSEDEQAILAGGAAGEFLKILEITPMTRSFKMLTLLAMLREDQLPGTIPIDKLVRGFAHLAGRSVKLRADVTVPLDSPQMLRQYLERNPIAAWTGGNATRQKVFFTYRDGVFATNFHLAPDARPLFQGLAREIIEWRLAEYLQRDRLNGLEAEG